MPTFRLESTAVRAILTIADLLADSLLMYVRRPDLLLMVCVVLFLIYRQYLRLARTEAMLYGMALSGPRRQASGALLAGLMGGMLATLLFVVVGIPLSGIGVWYIWLVALPLAIISPRFLCFSYAGSLVCLSHLLWQVPKDVHVPAIMALVAILHMVEAFLIAVTGADGATPVYVRAPNGKVVGGFWLQKAWPIPFAALVAGGVIIGQELPLWSGDMPLSSWWPLIQPVTMKGLVDQHLAYSLLPVLAALGYSELAITCRPEEKARHTAFLLVVYSLTLLALSVLGQQGRGWALVAVIFAPLGHEATIHWGRRREMRGEPAFTVSQGVMVLGVLPGSPAEKAGLVVGDVIKRFNDESVSTKRDLVTAMYPWAIDAQVEVGNVFTTKQRTLTCEGRVPPLGAILAPSADEPFFIDPYQPGRLERWLRSWRQRRAGGRSF